MDNRLPSAFTDQSVAGEVRLLKAKLKCLTEFIQELADNPVGASSYWSTKARDILRALKDFKL